MRRPRISARAVSYVRAKTEWAEAQIGPGYVPVIQLVIDERENPNLIPSLLLGFEKADVVDRSRVAECDGKNVEIFLYVPDESFGEDGRKYIDVRNNWLVFAEDP